MAKKPQTCFFLVSPVIRIQLYGGLQKRELLDRGHESPWSLPEITANPTNGIDHPNAEGTRTMPGDGHARIDHRIEHGPDDETTRF